MNAIVEHQVGKGVLRMQVDKPALILLCHLLDDSMRLVGWTNIETGEVKSPYPHLDPAKCKMYAFSGIHMVAPSIFPLMEEEPDKFPIMDFYLKHCDKVRIEGYVKNDLRLMDVGKQETLKEAEAFLCQC